MDVSKIRIGGRSSVVEAIAAIERVGTGVAAVVEPECQLIGIITDGEIRRDILQNFDLVAESLNSSNACRASSDQSSCRCRLVQAGPE